MLKTSCLAVVTLLLFSFFGSSTYVEASSVIYDQSHPPVIVMFDFGHGQYFNSTNGNFEKAINATKNLYNITIKENLNEPLSDNLLAGIDVLIITNLGEGYEFKEEKEVFEISAIEKFLTQGNGLFLLSNPLTNENETKGNPYALNKLMGGSGLGLSPPAQFWEQDGDADLVISEFDAVEEQNQTLIQLNSTSHYILGNQTSSGQEKSEIKPVNSILGISQSITKIETPLISTGRASYAIEKNGLSHTEADEPTIFGYNIYREVGRIALCGSTLMFSDLLTTYTINNETFTKAWFDAFDNEYLWINTILWLAGILPLPVLVEPSKSIGPNILYGAVIGTGGSAIIGGILLVIIGRNEPITAIEEVPKKLEKPKEKHEKPKKPKRVKPHKRKRR